jgi:hypothetical protein
VNNAPEVDIVFERIHDLELHASGAVIFGSDLVAAGVDGSACGFQIDVGDI